MKINIDFQGLNRILCKLGLHLYTNWYQDDYCDAHKKYEPVRYCEECSRYQCKPKTT